jgi:hypothetical protein
MGVWVIIGPVRSFLASPLLSSYGIPNYQKFSRGEVRGRERLERRQYRRNLCRELLARARQELVILIPRRWRRRAPANSICSPVCRSCHNPQNTLSIS